MPFAAPDFVAMGFKHATEPLISPKRFNPYVPLHIDQAICKAMAKDRANRFSDIDEFVAAFSMEQWSQKPLSSQEKRRSTAKSDTR